jgi:two-component system cell cycle response regulator
MNHDIELQESSLPTPVQRLADAGHLAGVIDRLAAAEPDEVLSIAVQEIVSLLRGDCGVSLLLGSGARIRGGTERRWCDESLDLETCPGLSAALAGVEPSGLAAGLRAVPPGTGAATRALLGRTGWLTVVPLLTGAGAMGWVVVRSDEPSSIPDKVARVTATITGRIAAAFAGRLSEQSSAPRPAAIRHIAAAGGRLEVLPDVTPAWGVPIVQVSGPRTVMVVEDDVDVAEGLRVALEEENYEVEVAGSAVVALAALQRSPVSLVILDVTLPDGDGFSIARSLARHRRTAHIPMLFLSAADDLATRVRSLHRDEADFLQKPFVWKELLTRVEQSILRAEHRSQLLFSANIDELTGLGNLRLLEERLSIEAARINRYGTPLSIVILDVDRLKVINDKHGHAAGSAVLRAVGEVLRNAVRETDMAARYGGDEFVVLLPHTDLDQAVAFAERVTLMLRSLRPGGLPVSLSLGVASFDKKRDDSIENLFERADQAAYRAKRDGGNRVAVDAEPNGS